MKLIKNIFIFFFFQNILAQDTLSFQKFFDYILNNHPLIQNAHLSTTNTLKTYLLKAKGQFDPKLSFDLQNKFFNDKNYFLYYNFEIKQPTYIGVDLNLNYNYAGGMYINNDAVIPPAGLYSIGASFPVLRNLMYDERRYNLQSSKLLYKNSQIFLNKQILETIQEIINDYWNFYLTYNIKMMYQDLVNASYQRYKNIVEAFKTGEIPAIDTLDAGNQYQNFLLSFQKSSLDYQNAKYQILTHLINYKDTNFIPPLVPDTFVFENIDTTFLVSKYPDIQAYQIKIKQLQMEKKWKTEMIKPLLNIKYNFLLQPFSNEHNYPLNTNNYKWGIDFYFPLFLRKERAELKLVNLKINQTKNDLIFKTNEVQNKIKIYYNNYINYYQQLAFASQLNKRYYKMLMAEMKNFQIGESNLFTINTREIYYLQSKAKVIELYQKYLYYQTWLKLYQKYSVQPAN